MSQHYRDVLTGLALAVAMGAAVFSWQAHSNDTARIESLRQEVQTLSKKVGHDKYVDRMVAAYDRARAAGESAHSASGKASEAKREAKP